MRGSKRPDGILQIVQKFKFRFFTINNIINTLGKELKLFVVQAKCSINLAIAFGLWLSGAGISLKVSS